MVRLKLQRPIVRFADGWSANLEQITESKAVRNAYNIKWRRGLKRGTARNVSDSKVHLIPSRRYKGSPNYDVYIIDTDKDGGNECLRYNHSQQELYELKEKIKELESMLQEDFMSKALKSVQFTRQIEGKVPIKIEKKESAPVVAQYFPQQATEKPHPLRKTKEDKDDEE